MVQNNNKTRLVFLFLLFSALLSHAAQPVRYWVKFKDKNGTTFSINRPSEFLSAKAIERRALSNVAIDETDLPVSSTYINTIEQVNNVKVIYASKWLNGVVIQLDSIDLAAAALITISNFSFVKSNSQVQKYRIDDSHSLNDFNEPPYPNANKSSESTSSTGSSGYGYGGSGAQIRQLRLDCLHERGYRGQGMVIAVLDAGFAYVDTNPIYDSLHARNGILGTRDFVSGGNNAFQGSTHGSMVMSCMAAIKPGVIYGTAPLADYWLLRTEAPNEYITEEYNWIRGAEFADSVGADILTTSLGYTEFDDASENHTYASLNGRTAPMSIAATMAARKGMFVLNAAGNERASSWHFISVPADADSICSVGAIDSVFKEAAFSSVGPTADGRIKPDLVSIGAGSWVSVDIPSAFPGNGTSFATPIMAGAVACYWQANRQLNNIEILRELKMNANNAGNPNNNIGWGVPNMCVTEHPHLRVNYAKETQQIQVVFSQSDYTGSTFELVDLQGKVHQSRPMKSNDRKYILDVTSLQDAIYFVRVRSKNGTYALKFVKS
jgi:subtilisin family serine protease